MISAFLYYQNVNKSRTEIPKTFRALFWEGYSNLWLCSYQNNIVSNLEKTIQLILKFVNCRHKKFNKMIRKIKILTFILLAGYSLTIHAQKYKAGIVAFYALSKTFSTPSKRLMFLMKNLRPEGQTNGLEIVVEKNQQQCHGHFPTG